MRLPTARERALTSSRADIEDPRVQQLADDIIKAQKREIAEMQELIEALK